MTAPSSTPSAKDVIYERLADQIAREDGLVNTRLNWTLTFQGLMFTALAIAAGKETDPTTKSLMVWVAPTLGIASGILCSIAVLAALLQLRWLRATYDQYFREEQSIYVRPAGFRLSHVLGNVYPVILPVLLAATWAIALVRLRPA